MDTDNRTKRIGLRYVGPGWVPGVPARDLTADEVEAYGGEVFLLGVESVHTGRPIYEVIEITIESDEEVSDGR